MVLEGVGVAALRPALVARISAALRACAAGCRVWDATPAGGVERTERVVHGAPTQTVVQARLSALSAARPGAGGRRGSATDARSTALATPRVPTAAVLAISDPDAAVVAQLLRLLGEQDNLALLGVKVLVDVEMNQAREVTPFEVGDKQWKASLTSITWLVVGGGGKGGWRNQETPKVATLWKSPRRLGPDRGHQGSPSPASLSSLLLLSPSILQQCAAGHFCCAWLRRHYRAWKSVRLRCAATLSHPAVSFCSHPVALSPLPPPRTHPPPPGAFLSLATQLSQASAERCHAVADAGRCLPLNLPLFS